MVGQPIKKMKPVMNDGYFKPDSRIADDGTPEAVCQCGEWRDKSLLSSGWAGWASISQPCYYCSECIPL